MPQFNALGNPDAEVGRNLETFPTPGNVKRVTLRSGELTTYCPVTKHPDFYELEISFAPDALCLESKSLKLYIESWRDEGAFAETLASRIASDVFDALKPHSVTVTLKQEVRGGIAIDTVAEITR